MDGSRVAMSKKPRKEKGWIETIYGDYWAKRKKLIVVGFFIPLLFCFFTYLEFSYILSWMGNIPFDLHSLYFEIIAQCGQPTLLYTFLILIVVSTIILVFFSSLRRFFELPIKRTYQEIFIEKKGLPRTLLIKNIFISSLIHGSRVIDVFIVTLVLMILFIPALFVGYVAYTYINLSSIPTLITNISLLPNIGETLQEVAIFITETIGKEVNQIYINMPPLLIAIILIIPIILLLAVYDLIESNVLRKQRGTFREILKNGLRLIIFNLNLAGKIGGFINTTLLCLFTQQTNVSLNIPVINDRNVEDAFQSVLGGNKVCYIVRVPNLSPAKTIQELEKLPKPLQDEIREALEAEMKKWRFKILKSILEHIMKSDTMKSAGKQIENRVSRAATKNLSRIICSMNENGVVAYALVNVPPPTHMTRIISMLWCSDPFVKERIVKKIEDLESV